MKAPTSPRVEPVPASKPVPYPAGPSTHWFLRDVPYRKRIVMLCWDAQEGVIARHLVNCARFDFKFWIDGPMLPVNPRWREVVAARPPVNQLYRLQDPVLAEVDWDELDLYGWSDRINPKRGERSRSRVTVHH